MIRTVKSMVIGALLSVFCNATVAGDTVSITGSAKSELQLRQLAQSAYFERLSANGMQQVLASLRELTPSEARSVAYYAREIAQATGRATKAMQSAAPAIEEFENRLADYFPMAFGPGKTIWNLTPNEYAELDNFIATDDVANSALESAVNSISSDALEGGLQPTASGCVSDTKWPKKFNRVSGSGGYLPSGTGRVFNTPGEVCDFKATSPSKSFRSVYGVSVAMHSCVLGWGGFNGLSAKSDYSAAIVGYGRLAACTLFLGANEWYVKNYLAFK